MYCRISEQTLSVNLLCTGCEKVIRILCETLLGGNRFLVSTIVFPFTQIPLPEREVSRDLHVRLSAMFPLPTMATPYTECFNERSVSPRFIIPPRIHETTSRTQVRLHWRSWERYVCHWTQFFQRCHYTSSSSTKHWSAKNSTTKVS